jgi:hypothetical protein
MNKSLLAFISLTLAAACMAQNVPASSSADQQGPGATAESRAGRRIPGAVGSITAIDEKIITLKAMDGRAVTVSLSDKTQFRKDRQPAKLADFKIGDMVMVRGQSTGENTFQADLVATRSGNPQQFREGMGKRFIAGVVKSIDGTHLTINRFDGATQTITVDENTSFRKEGESITLADLHPGDHVIARGELKDGVFVSATLVVGDAALMQLAPAQKSGTDSH